MRSILRGETEIDDLLNAVTEANNDGRSKWPGLTYEQGVENALLWLFGDTEDHPYQEE